MAKGTLVGSWEKKKGKKEKGSSVVALTICTSNEILLYKPIFTFWIHTENPSCWKICFGALYLKAHFLAPYDKYTA